MYQFDVCEKTFMVMQDGRPMGIVPAHAREEFIKAVRNGLLKPEPTPQKALTVAAQQPHAFQPCADLRIVHFNGRAEYEVPPHAQDGFKRDIESGAFKVDPVVVKRPQLRLVD